MKLVPPTHPALWTPAQPVTDFAPIDGLANELIELAIRSQGVGLAATQVGLSICLFVLRTNGGWLVCVNPAILSRGRDMVTQLEGCLTFPGQLAPVERHRVIGVEYADETGKVKRAVLKGDIARAFAHELDHLNGACIFPRPTENGA